MTDAAIVEASRSNHLLVVDDDGQDRRHYSRLLTRKAPGAFMITEAGGGRAGLAALRADQPDCILLDYSLPDMNGFDFLAEAAAGGELSSAVVLITGHGNESIAVEAMKRGVQDYLVKEQVNENSLWRAVTRAVIQKQLQLRLAGSLGELKAANAQLEHEVAVREAAEMELRAAKEAAEQANLAKTRFVAMVTHELRTPLNGILGYAQLLRVEGGLSITQDARVGEMMQAGQHLLGMIEQVLDFARIETGRLTLHPEAVAVRELGAGCIGLIEPMALRQGLSLRLLSAHDTPHRLMVDPSRLRQIILNLLGNAVKYTRAGGVELRLLAGATGGGLRVEVADTGPGITPANLASLFQDFERLDAAPSVEGAGLGLAIAARLVRLMGGTIGHVPNPGGGSIFWFDLPGGGPVAAPLPPLAAPAAAPVRGQRLLLVDDIAMNRDVIGALLRAGGHTVVVATGGAEAVRLAAEQGFDLILMDIAMPEIDGLEATRRIRALPAPHGRVPILALTAYSFADQTRQCRTAGMNGHVGKPVDFTTLNRAIAEAICAAPAAAAATDAPAALPRLNRDVLQEILGVLAPEEGDDHLCTLAARMHEMRRLLDGEAIPAELAAAAHGLASVAGMFGFVALSFAARDFERVVAGEAAPDPALAPRMRNETEAALAALEAFMRQRAVALS